MEHATERRLAGSAALKAVTPQCNIAPTLLGCRDQMSTNQPQSYDGCGLRMHHDMYDIAIMRALSANTDVLAAGPRSPVHAAQCRRALVSRPRAPGGSSLGAVQP